MTVGDERLQPVAENVLEIVKGGGERSAVLTVHLL